MPPEIQALIAKPELLIAVLAVGALAGMAIEQFLAQLRRKAWRTKSKKNQPNIATGPWSEHRAPHRLDAADQLRIVMGSKFAAQSLLNKSEARVFKELDPIVTGRNPDWRVMAQVSLGEVLWCEDKDAFGCINAKRVDLLLMDGDCRPRHVIEYQGGAHYQETAAARDAVKKEALRRAGIGYHEVVAGHTTPADLRRLIEKLVEKPVAVQ